MDELLGLDDVVDLVIPRGSYALVRHVQAHTRIPVLGHSEGVCHIYVDGAADFAMALEIIDDAKTDYPAACNAVETVLVRRDIAASFLPALAERMRARGVRLRGSREAIAALPGTPMELVAEDEWHTEYGDLILAVKVVAWARRSDGTHRAIRVGAYRRDCYRGCGGGEHISGAGGFGGRVSQRFDAIFGWVSLRIWRGSGHQHEPAARARARRACGARDIQVHVARRRAGGARLSGSGGARRLCIGGMISAG